MIEWQQSWECFLNESEDTELGSSGNVKEWISDKLSALKASSKQALRSAIEELIESKEAGQLFMKYASGKQLTPEEEQFLKEQAVDVLRSLGLAGIVALPGGAIALKFLLSAAQKMGIELLPSAFRDEEIEEANNSKFPFPADWSPESHAIAAMTGMAEGRRSHADTLSKQVTSDIIEYLKNEFSDGDPDSTFFGDYYLKNIDTKIEVEFTVNVAKTGTTQPFLIDSGIYPDAKPPLVDIKMTFDARHPISQSLEGIYFKLLEDVRHELEHLITQLSPDPGESRAAHYIDKGEIPSMVRGLHLRAKKTKIPTEEMFRRELQPYLETGEITPEESEEILQLWKQELDKIQAKEN